MCGIAGEVRFDNSRASIEAAKKMMQVMAPRGPDNEGLYCDRNRVFVHTRLAIIDLSPQSAQPMIDNDLGLGIVFNGEIYNYRELREELRARGYKFFSNGDTEVLLKGYHAWGESFLQRLQGIFALAIWERDSQRVFIARDRLGVKPLYYSHKGATLRFSSSLPALLQAAETHEIDPVALNHYMSFHAVVPAPRTLLKDIKKLPPACYMVVEPQQEPKIERYWQVDFKATPSDSSLSFEDWKVQLASKLSSAVQKRLVADVPVGVLLSGGLDSSLIVGLLDRLGKKDVETFSIGFEDAGGEAGNEFQYSDLIAQRFRTKHHKIFVKAPDAIENLKACMSAMSEPMVSHDCIGFYLLSKEVSRHLKVVQSGQGADEIFAGYHWYPPMTDAVDPVSTYSEVFFDRDFSEYSKAVTHDYIVEDFAKAFVTDHFGMPGADSAIDKALRLDTLVMLVDDPVKRVDNMTMAWGLEARVPFLDHDLVELAARIPADYKVKGGGKYILKEVARDYVPAEVIDRPKGYFPVPGLKYIQGEYLTFLRDILDSRKSRERGLFRRDYVDTLLADPEKHITPLRGSKLWQIAALELWLQTHGL